MNVHVKYFRNIFCLQRNNIMFWNLRYFMILRELLDETNIQNSEYSLLENNRKFTF